MGFERACFLLYIISLLLHLSPLIFLSLTSLFLNVCSFVLFSIALRRLPHSPLLFNRLSFLRLDFPAAPPSSTFFPSLDRILNFIIIFSSSSLRCASLPASPRRARLFRPDVEIRSVPGAQTETQTWKHTGCN